MRVVYVNQDAGISPGRRKGAAVHVAAMQHAFRALGCEVVPLEEKDSARAEDVLDSLHSERPIDLVYERYALAADAAVRFARRRRVPHVLEVNSPLIEEGSAHRGLPADDAARSREASVLAAADHVFAVSSGVADYVASLGVPRVRIHVHPNAVDTERFHPRPSEDVRRQLGIPPGRFVLGFHGRLRPWHGFGRIVEAARTLVARGREIHVLTVGEGGFAEALAAAGLQGRSTCLPWVAHEEVPRLVACFHALPLAYDGGPAFYFSPLKLLEAMGSGVVPVVPALGDLPDVVDGGAAGLVYPAGCTDELVRGLERLADDRELRERLANRGVELAERRSWTAIAREALALARAARVA